MSILLLGESSARGLQADLARLGFRMTRSAFHQVMRRLTRLIIVDARWRGFRVGGHTCWEHRYRVPDRGLELWKAARNFYTARAGNRS